jgi:hypothetical protein
MKRRIYQKPLTGSYSNLKLKLLGSNQGGKGYQMKTTSNGRLPQNMKSRISQQPLVGSYSNLKLKLLGSKQSAKSYQMKTNSNGRRPPAEDGQQI